MKLTGNKINIEYTPLQVSGNLLITGGTSAQFYDGENYYPNRSGSPASPIILTHLLDVNDLDGILEEVPEYSTLFYVNDVLVNNDTDHYEIIGDNELKVTKNVPGGTAVTIRAVSSFVDPRSARVYEREDITYLRTIIKSTLPYQLELTPSGRQFFDAYRNPNTTTSVTATLKVGGDDVADYTGITFKWLNRDGIDCVENELYADEYTNGDRTLTVDKTYIDRETIHCEAWIGSKRIADDSITFVRRFNSFSSKITIPELPLTPGVSTLNCFIELTDHIGPIDVDAAFLVEWYAKEGNKNPRSIGSGYSIQVPVDNINLEASNVEIYPDLRRREAWAALVTDDDSVLVMDDGETVITTETYGK